MIRFINRTNEIALLEKDWGELKNAFIVVYGRRRIGKTRLLEEFLKDKDGIKYTAEDTNKSIQISELKDIIASYTKDEFLQGQKILDWSSLFSYLAKTLSKDKRIYIWIDEFSYLIKSDKTIASILQKFIDSFLKESKIFFIVSGSLFGLMSTSILAYSSPLYGRRSRDILLKQVSSQYIPQFLNMKFNESFCVALTIGGVPEYLSVASRYKKYDKFIDEEFLKKDGYFYREPFFLLSQEFKEIKTYFSIINAIAYGNSKPGDIANFVGINAREIYPYLELLISYGFVRRETPIFSDKKRGIYVINDVFLSFWFNFVHKHREQIESGRCSLNDEGLNTFLGKRFELFINENFALFFEAFDEYGRYWHKDVEIDVVAINEAKKEILFAECKWQEKVNTASILNKLNEKTKLVGWNEKDRKEIFAIFARSFSKRINDFEGKKVFCFDLNDIEKAMKKNLKK